MKFVKPPPSLVQLFDALQREVGGVRRQMFGYPCAFENGNLFTGLFGDGLFVRVGEGERTELLQSKAGAPFEPMKGRPMREYVLLSASLLEDEAAVESWMRRALEYATSLPPKEKRQARAKKPKRAASRR